MTFRTACKKRNEKKTCGFDSPIRNSEITKKGRWANPTWACALVRAFGVMKRAFYRRLTIQTTDDVMDVVDASSSEQVDHVDTSTGEVQWYDWGEFFSQFRCQAMPGIAQNHVFEFERSPDPLSVSMYEWSSDLLVEGKGECLRLFPSHMRAEMLAHPAEHGVKNISEFTLNPVKLSKNRCDVLHDLLPGFLTVEGKIKVCFMHICIFMHKSKYA